MKYKGCIVTDGKHRYEVKVNAHENMYYVHVENAPDYHGRTMSFDVLTKQIESGEWRVSSEPFKEGQLFNLSSGLTRVILKVTPTYIVHSRYRGSTNSNGVKTLLPEVYNRFRKGTWNMVPENTSRPDTTLSPYYIKTEEKQMLNIDKYKDELISNVTLVHGADVSTMTAEDFYRKLEQLQQKQEALKALPKNSKYISAQLKQVEDDISALVDLMDITLNVEGM